MKILIADDHPLTLQGTINLVESYGYKTAHVCSNGTAALNLIELHQPDVAILDINMPGMDGIDVAQKVFESRLKTKVILLTMHNEKTLFNKAMEYGVFGYVLKEQAITELEKCLVALQNGTEYISEALKQVAKPDANENGELAKLTFSERKIVELISQQKTAREIAEMLFLSEQAIENHQNSIIAKLGLPNEQNVLQQWAMRKDAADGRMV